MNFSVAADSSATASSSLAGPRKTPPLACTDSTLDTNPPPRSETAGEPLGMIEDPIFPTLQRAVSTKAACAAGWRIDNDRTGSPLWISVRNAHADLPRQGWKLHISASILSAAEALDKSLPVLLDECTGFKVAASLNVLTDLNNGKGGLSQIGKFITVYPEDDTQAVRLATALHAATRGLRAPRIPSDRQLVPDSLVHYRYGGFQDRQIQTTLGEILPVLQTPSGELVPDRRDGHPCPGWAFDPFRHAGIAIEAPPPSLLIEDRFLIISKLQQSPRGTVFLAVDTHQSRSCVLKAANRDAFWAPMARTRATSCAGRRPRSHGLPRMVDSPNSTVWWSATTILSW